jgi:hypothetical protein
MSIAITGTNAISLSVSGGTAPIAVAISGLTNSGAVALSVSGGVGPMGYISGTSTIALFLSPPVLSVQSRTGNVTLTLADLTAAAASHAHSTGDVAGLTAAIQTYSKVVSVQGKSGTVTLSVSDLTAAAASHTHSTTSINSFTAAVSSVVLSIVGTSQGSGGGIPITYLFGG